ncbi:FtsK/SpoIIIE domain-containing protein [Streptomyces sp. NBC_01788]|uniref:FtsK/SpoIIIE domain-containing protein n=1 Tax=Streptomyces sp. NBC_01788 TaxID=2975940 RepID=UPI002DD98910|nr:FtsK/SpoIIIE domain-containing protein [Streptomyces sp. NBC_01788]WSB28515.1 FtsK/SpoIIIE domain-containing protein [Streptomyces sp. NBC_01788]
MTVSVRDPRIEGVSTTVVVDTEPSAQAGRFAAELARAVGHAQADGAGAPEPALYIGSTPVDPQATLQTAGVRDGMDLGLGTPVPQEPEAEGHSEVRVVSGPGAGTVFRLVPGDYDIGSGPSCRIRLAGTAPTLAARVRVRLDGSAELLRADMALVDGRSATAPSPWQEGSQLTVGDILLELTSRQDSRAPLTPAQDGLGLEFNRPPRFLPPAAGAKFRLPAPPAKPDKRPIPLLPILLLPAGSAMIAIFVTQRWSFVFIALLSPIAALITQFGGRKQAMLKYLEKKEEYEQTLVRVRADVDQAVIEEQHNLRLSLPDPAALLQMAAQPSERLWERRWQDPDFLSVRVGTADLPSSSSVDDPTQDEHRRTTVPQLNQVPVATSLRRVGVAGIAGTGAARLAGWMTAQAAALHSPADLRIVVLAGPDGEQDWSWTRWLPHTQAQGEDAYALLGSTAHSLARRIGELGQIVASRIGAGPDLTRGGANGYPDILVVLEQARRARSLPGVIALLRDGPSVGVHTLCIDREERLLPEECGAVVVTEAGATTASKVRTGAGAGLEGVRTDSPEAGWYEHFGRALAPLRGVGDSDESTLPGSVRLLELLDIEPPTAEAVVAGWSLGGRSTMAVLGTGYDGPFAVDLVRDGPHALIAGTTGSGKSELLQTLVATLAVVNRPDEMTFVLVDYKGGSAFAECADLPHTVGTVTDLDTHLVERALVSLGAELRRRETQLAQAGAKDIEDYLDKRSRGGDVLPPLPRLMLVIDEFASMVRELPDFISGLVNIAQRGRSLGIHLVLATQRPGGAVTPDIRANTNLRIALRTTDTTESRDIIDAPDSGEISPANPGRAYARLGPSALLPFQSGRVGGRRPGGHTADGTRTVIRAEAVSWQEIGGPLPRDGARGGARPAQTEAVTDLAVLTGAVAQAARLAGIPRQASPWLPPLPGLLTRTPEAAPAPAAERAPALPAVEYGVVDLPAQQTRAPLVFDLDRSGHLHIIGSPRSGRSQTLRTLAAALAEAHGADDVHLYGIDCGNGALNALTALPHCGAVVDRNQTERLGRLLERLNSELTARQSILGTRGTADLTELRKAQNPGERLPHIVLMVDRFEVFEREFASYDNGSYMERLVRLLRDGAGVGVHVVLAGDRVLGGSRFSGTTEDKIVLRLNDRQDYSTVGIPTRSAPADLPPGRGIRPQDLSEVQIAVLSEDLAGTAQAEVLTDLGRRLSERESAVPAERLPLRLDVLPDRIGYADALALHSHGGPTRPLVAVGGDTLTSLSPDLADVPTFVIAGPPRTGRSSALLTAAHSLLAAGAGLIVLAPRRSPLRLLQGRPGVAAVITDAEVPVNEFRPALGNVPEENGVIVVDDAELFMGAEIDADLALLARGGAGTGWGVLAAGNAESLSLSLAGWMGQVKRNRTGMLLSPQGLSDGEVIGVKLTRGVVGQAPQPGRGLLHLGDGTLRTVQVPLPDTDL